MKRAMMKISELPAAPVPIALMMKATAASSMTLRRPMMSASLPARKATTAQPIRIAPTFTPVPSALRSKAFSSPSWVPLMTPAVVAEHEAADRRHRDDRADETHVRPRRACLRHLVLPLVAHASRGSRMTCASPPRPDCECNWLIRVGHKIAERAGRTGKVAKRIDRTHEVAAAELRTDRLENQDVTPTEFAAWCKVVRPDGRPLRVKQDAWISLGNAQATSSVDKHAALRGPGETPSQLGRRTLRRGRRRRSASRGNEQKHDRTAAHRVELLVFRRSWNGFLLQLRMARARRNQLDLSRASASPAKVLISEAHVKAPPASLA